MDRKSVNHARIGVITALAERQHGVIAAPQLYSLGLSETQVRTRAGNGLLHRVHRGVYAMGHAHLTNQGTLDGGGARVLERTRSSAIKPPESSGMCAC